MNNLKLFGKNAKTTNNDSGSYKIDERTPLVRTNDLNNGLVEVKMYIPGLEQGRDKYHPKGGKISLDFFNTGRGFDMTAVLIDKTKKLKTIFKFRVKQLPGRVDTGESKWEVVKGAVVLMIEKHADERNIDWKPAVYSRGLDQLSSSSSDDD